MVWPMIAAAAIGAGGNLLGGLLGNDAQEQANEMNYQISLLNYYAEQEARQQAQGEARRQEREGKLGTTDADGNRSYFKPGVGWVVERSGKGKEKADLYEREELAQLNEDLPEARAQRRRNYSRQQTEDTTASGLLQAMLRNYRGDASATVDRRNRMTAESANEGYDTGMTEAMKDAMRTGSGGQAKIAAQFGRDKFQALRKAFMENSEGAQDTEDAKFMTEQGNIANLYNQFATRASATDAQPYNPRNLEGLEASALSGAMGGGRSGSSALMQAMSSNPAQLNYQHEPNFGLANTVQQVGAGLAGAFNLYDSTRGNGQQNYGQYASNNYFPSAPSGGSKTSSIYKGNTGFF